MAFLMAIYQWFVANSVSLAAIFLALWGLSESLAQIPWIAANSVYQAIRNGLSWVKNLLFPPAPPASK